MIPLILISIDSIDYPNPRTFRDEELCKWYGCYVTLMRTEGTMMNGQLFGKGKGCGHGTAASSTSTTSAGAGVGGSGRGGGEFLLTPQPQTTRRSTIEPIVHSVPHHQRHHPQRHHQLHADRRRSSGDDNNYCHEDGDSATAARPGNPPLASLLTNQTWHEVGNSPHPINATDEFDVMVDQLSSILAMRLRNLLVHRITGSDGVRSSTSSASIDSSNSTTNPSPSSSSSSASAMEYLKVDTRIGDFVLADSISNSIREYVKQIGRMYNAVGFHSFEHATHVTISMNKLLSMINTVNSNLFSHVQSWTSGLNLASRDHERQAGGGGHHGCGADDDVSSFGIGEDPRILFAMVFSALIHDVGHRGVPNSVLVEEEDELAILHNDVSVAEQNSLQVAFSVLRQDEFAGLKNCICPTSEERKFFRKTVISMVMVTDISDQERVQIAASRWNAAFPTSCSALLGGNTIGGAGRAGMHLLTLPSKKKGIQSSELKSSISRRRFTQFTTDAAVEEFRLSARLGIRTSMDMSGMLIDAYHTIDQLQQHAVLETIMNVADVAHTMQSFRVFVKWNKRLFKELYVAYLSNRLSFNPSENWCQNQIGFFSHFILPLTLKLKRCGIFGSTGSVFEYFATENKKRWMNEGEEISKEIIRDVKNEVEREQAIALNGVYAKETKAPNEILDVEYEAESEQAFSTNENVHEISNAIVRGVTKEVEREQAITTDENGVCDRD
jgi:hypothetical protein